MLPNLDEPLLLNQNKSTCAVSVKENPPPPKCETKRYRRPLVVSTGVTAITVGLQRILIIFVLIHKFDAIKRN